MVMRKFAAIIALFLLFIFATISVSAQERINSFKSDVRVNKDGTINVREEIVYDFGSIYRHGIFRNIPFIKKNKDGKKYLLESTVERVIDEKRTPYKYTISKNGENLDIKIGDPDVTITGVNTYIIEYEVKGAITYFSDNDELYWNATGNEWQVPIDEATTIILLPEQVASEKVRLTCYTGSFGSTGSDCSSAYDGGRATFGSSQPFSSGEGLTVVVGFPKNLVAVVEPKPYVPFWETWHGRIIIFLIVSMLIIASVLWYVVYPVWIIIKWFKYGRDPKVAEGPVSAWFDPPKTASGRLLTPGETGTLIDEHAEQKDVSAMMVDLARRGFLKIEERKKKDFYLISRGKNQRGLLPFEKTMMNEVFDGEKEVRLKNEHLYTTVEKAKTELYDELVKEKFFPKNPHSIRTFYTVITILALTTFNLPLFLISIIFGRSMPAKTILGAQAANVAKSLRNFLSSQERQLEFQAKKQLMFEKLLPYAVAFGVEKIWAQRFKDIDLKEPDWYSGYDRARFNSVVFAGSLNSSLNSLSSAATPTSSSSGFSSGFSGGSSGGGGGGGGGGSW